MSTRLTEDERLWPNFCYSNPTSPATGDAIDRLWEERDDPEQEARLLQCLLMLHQGSGSFMDVLAQFRRNPELAGVMVPKIVSYAEKYRGNNAIKGSLCETYSVLIVETVMAVPDQTDIILDRILSTRILPVRNFFYLTALLTAVEDESRRQSLYAKIVGVLQYKCPQSAYEMAKWASKGGIHFDWQSEW